MPGKAFFFLKCAGVLIKINGCKKGFLTQEAFFGKKFILSFSKNKPDITLDVIITPTPPIYRHKKSIFYVSRSWEFFRCKDKFILEGVNQKSKKIFLVVMHSDFNQGRVFIPSSERDELALAFYMFLQIILINYLARKKVGIFVHGLGVNDNRRGIIFVGPSGAGKSTTARLWDKYSPAEVLNDDRLVLCKQNGEFLAYSTPWGGDFYGNFNLIKNKVVRLSRCFFIYHSAKNECRRLKPKEAFSYFYPNIFSTYWDKAGVEFLSSFILDIAVNVPCYRLGFVNNEKLIDFVRNINEAPLTSTMSRVQFLPAQIDAWQAGALSKKR